MLTETKIWKHENSLTYPIDTSNVDSRYGSILNSLKRQSLGLLIWSVILGSSLEFQGALEDPPQFWNTHENPKAINLNGALVWYHIVLPRFDSRAPTWFTVEGIGQVNHD